MIGTLVVGGMNVWHKSWLKHSQADTADGEHLHRICKTNSLKQLVTEPTRGANLLDLALSSVPASSSAKVLSAISDYASVLVLLDVPMQRINTLDRTVWDFARADWKSLLAVLESFAWKDVLKYDNPDAAVEMFCAIIFDKARQYIPMKHISERKGSHPCVDEHCLEAIRHKHANQGTESYEAAARACTDAISAAYRKYIKKKKSDLKLN